MNYDGCLRPCVLTTTKLLQTNKFGSANFKDKMVKFFFDEEIQTEVVSVDKFDFLVALNYLGSNLGLFPGMGLFQIMEILVTFCLIHYKVIYKVFLIS